MVGGYWESYYRRGHVPWDPGPYDRNLPEILKRYSIEPGRVLDVGCGTGGTLVYLAERGFEATGVDISPTAIEEARRKARVAGVACRWIVADFPEGVDEETLPDASFDLVIERGFLHMFTYRQEHQSILKRLRRLLAPSGLIYGLFAKREGAQSFGGPPKWSETAIRDAAAPHFSDISLIPSVFTPGEPGSMPAWILVAKKR